MQLLTCVLPAAAIGLAVAACGLGPVPSSSGTPDIGGSAPPPTAVSTAEAGAGDWHRLPDPAAFSNASVRSFAAVPDGFVAVGCTTLPGGLECDLPAVWYATNAITWSEPISLPMAPGEAAGMARAALATSAGLVVGGEVRRGDRVHAALWVAADGRSFERVADDRSLDDALVVALASVDDRVVAIGSGAFMEWGGFRAWSSDDGRTWADATPAGTDESYPMGVLAREDGLVAWGPTCSVCPPSTAWWVAVDGISWEEKAVDLGGRFAHVTVVAEVPGGLVAYGNAGGGDDPVRPAGWFLANDADSWETAVAPDAPDPGIVNRFLLVGHGSVLGGTAWSQPAQRGLVWYQGPGDAAWRLAAQLPGIEVVALLQDPVALERLIVIGRDSSGSGRMAIWTGTVDWAP